MPRPLPLSLCSPGSLRTKEPQKPIYRKERTLPLHHFLFLIRVTMASVSIDPLTEGKLARVSDAEV